MPTRFYENRGRTAAQLLTTLATAYDPALNLVYWGTGNAAADFYDAERVPSGSDKNKEINLFTASVAVKAASRTNGNKVAFRTRGRHGWPAFNQDKSLSG